MSEQNPLTYGQIAATDPLARTARPASPNWLVWLLSAIYVFAGYEFMAIALDQPAGLLEAEFAAGWAEALFAVMGAFFAFVGLRSLLRLVRGVALPPDPLRNRGPAIVMGIVCMDLATWLGLILIVEGLQDNVARIEKGQWFVWTFIVLLLLQGLMFVINPAKTIRRQRLEQGLGLEGRATINSVRDTGTTINESPRVELDLQIAVEGRAPYSLVHTETVPRLSIGRLVPGSSVPVKVDPEDPEVLVIRWDEP